MEFLDPNKKNLIAEVSTKVKIPFSVKTFPSVVLLLIIMMMRILKAVYIVWDEPSTIMGPHDYVIRTSLIWKAGQAIGSHHQFVILVSSEMNYLHPGSGREFRQVS